jgi:mono/diheme cytochrome c family protein
LVGAAALFGLAGGGPLYAATTAAARESDYVDTFPFPVTRGVLRHGQDRFLIYCVVCHDPLGHGRGKIVERGYTPPPSFHIERLRRAPVGHFFDVITNGYGSMPDYRQQVPVRDRWAIVAYVRALQLSQHYPERDLSADMRAEWDRQREALKAGGAGE